MRHALALRALVPFVLLTLAAGCGSDVTADQDGGTTDAGAVDGGGAPMVELASSTIVADSPVLADGEARGAVTVTALAADGRPVPGVVVVLASSRGDVDTLVQPAGPTGDDGTAQGFVSSSTEGEAVLSATLDGEALPQTATVTFQTDCTPVDETCNGLDDDCDGQTDEDLLAAPGECLADGVCAGAHVTCDTDGNVTCVYPDGYVADEGDGLCDDLDNDCDGQTDEGCPCTDGDTRSCSSDEGACSVGTETCTGGVWGGCTGVEPVDELCNGLDDDCDGETDEAFSLGSACSMPGACGDGVLVCAQDGQSTYCSARDNVSPELCDGVDNDCDGQTDEEVDLDADGSYGCGGPDCNDQDPNMGPAAPELCNGIDDNCDGTTDENTDAACDDGAFCNGVETCQSGACVQGAAPDCDDGVACTNDACDEGQRACTHTPDDASCDDGLFCNGAETCDPAAGCLAGLAPVCDDGIPCTVDACDNDLAACTNTPDDTVCADGNGCTLDVCDPGAGCTNPDAQGTTCTVGGCTSTCQAGECAGCTCTTAADCDDGIACTTDTCDGGICANLPDAGLCDDGDACTVDACDVSLGCRTTTRTVDTASAVGATSRCLTLGASATSVVWADLRDTTGVPLTGLSVTFTAGTGSWVEAAAVESTTQPGLYYRTLVAPSAGSPASTTVTVAAQGCGQDVTLPPVQIDLADAVAFAGGGTGGCAPQDGNVRVRVIEEETGAPIAGAFVMIGDAYAATGLQTDFEAFLSGGAGQAPNALTTDADGYAVFHDLGAGLDGSQVITAGAAARAYLTLAGIGASDVVLPLPVTSPSRTDVTLQGDVTPSYATNNDLRLEVALVTPTLDLGFLTSFQLSNLFENDRDATISGWLCPTTTLPIPGNVHVQDQSALGCSVSATPPQWTLTPRQDSGDIGLTAIQASGSLTDLQNAGAASDLLTAMRFDQAGLLTGVSTASDQTGLDVPLSQSLSATMPVAASNAPLGDLYLLAAGDLDGGNGSGRLFLEGLSAATGASSLTSSLTTAPASGVFAGKRDLAAAIVVPTTGGVSVVLDRTTVGRNAQRTLDSFFSTPTVTRSGRVFTWSDVTTLNSPAAVTLARSVLRRVSADGSYATYDEPFWIVLTPGDRTSFSLPSLPAMAPRAATGGYLTAGSGQVDAWYLGLMNLGLSTGPVDLAAFDFADQEGLVTHLSAADTAL